MDFHDLVKRTLETFKHSNSDINRSTFTPEFKRFLYLLLTQLKLHVDCFVRFCDFDECKNQQINGQYGNVDAKS